MVATSNRDATNTVLTIAERERLLLAPYATRSADSQGRRYPEPEHPYRGPFQRDRDRITHSAAFRRLSGKMQVFTGDRGDYHRTRLTHTYEVASIARTIGRTLRLNEDLIEALALFHDIGHPPFGHAGEDALDECLRDEGGFSHNRYALTLVEELETRYPRCPGLNLTHEVLAGQTSRIDKAAVQLSSLEAQVVDIADSITYDAHDTDDAVKLGLVTLGELGEIQLIKRTMAIVYDRFGRLRGDILRKAVVHELIDSQVSEVLDYAIQYLSQNALASAALARQTGIRLGSPPALEQRKSELEAFLYDRVYRHPELVRVRLDAQLRLRAMFDGYVLRPSLLPPSFRRRSEQVGLRQAVGDYLAGMTDRYCDLQYRTHFAPRSGG